MSPLNCINDLHHMHSVSKSVVLSVGAASQSVPAFTNSFSRCHHSSWEYCLRRQEFDQRDVLQEITSSVYWRILDQSIPAMWNKGWCIDSGNCSILFEYSTPLHLLRFNNLSRSQLTVICWHMMNWSKSGQPLVWDWRIVHCMSLKLSLTLPAKSGKIIDVVH